MIFKNCNIVLFDRIFHGNFSTENGIITSISDSIKEDGIDMDNAYILPGFVDIHVHGGGGHDFMDRSEEAFIAASDFHLKHGTVALCPTTLTAEMSELFTLFDIYNDVKDKCRARLLGVHLEGPYVSPSQLGAQDPKYAHVPRDGSFDEILSRACDKIAIWTMAPELDGAMDLIKRATEVGIKVSLGHSDCTYDDVVSAKENGATMVTHLFSSMSTIKRVDGVRVPGLLESALISDNLKIELIADGMHVPPPLIKIVLKCVPQENIILVTDAMRGAGQDSGPSILGSLKRGQDVVIRDGVARMPDGISFAGSVATADRLLRTMVESLGVDLPSAARMLSYNPAKALDREDEFGLLEVGRRADFVVLDSNLQVKDVYLASEKVV